MIRTWLAASALALSTLPAWAERDSARVYIFGNSLVNHLSERSEHTSVPYWLGQMARADGRGLALDGEWGFLRSFADSLPPAPNWSFPGVQGAWSSGDFGSADFDAVIVTPANFIQYQLPDVPYDGDNPSGESPFGATLRLMDWVHDAEPGARLFVYEGWSEIGTVTGGFPPSPEAARRYQEHNAGDYHLWFTDLIDRLNTARPDRSVTLIPVASALADLFGEDGLLQDMPAEALYTDADGHGTPTLYLLAAMAVWPHLYETPPPEAFSPPATLHPLLVEHYAEIAAALWEATPDPAPERAEAEGAPDAPEAAAAEPLPERQPVALPPPGLRPEGVPALGMGLNGLADWSTQHPFLNLMKTARPWVGHAGGQWGAVSTEALRAGGHLSEDGWPQSLPEDVTALEAVLLTDQPEEAEYLRGDYVLTYAGKGDLTLTGRARRIRAEPGRITFSYDPGEGLVGLQLTATDAADPIRDVAIVREEMLPLHEAGALFNPLWLERVQDLRSVRFMDWMMTNGSPIQTWEDRPRLTDATWTEWGVPPEVMIRLANQIGADPWFTMPHMADDDYIRRFAGMVAEGLDPRLKAYVEYSNEVWNRIFPQSVWANDQATALWGTSETGWAQFYGMRAAQVMDLWSEAFEDDSRLIRVVATHTGWPGLEETILQAPLAFLKLGKAPVDSFDAYAVTGYFGYEMGGEDMAQRMNAWLDRSEEVATAEGEAQGLRRVALREFVKEARFDAAIAPVTLALEEGSLRQLVEEVFPYHAAAAAKEDLRLVMYEGGTHVTAHGAQVNDERLTDFFAAFNYTPEMAKLYGLLLAGWTASGGTLFNAFVDVAPASKWGSWGALRHLDDANPRWDMLTAFNASGPNGWEKRDAQAFANGVTAVAGGGAQRLEGTPEEDVLLGGPGDDVLVSGGGADVLGGGPGADRAILPGLRADYSFTRADGRLLAKGPSDTVILHSIETLEFSDGTSVPTEDL
ncbi:hypothetical protein [Ponticoccus alexandrii]|uniref:Calcium-binding protein n=1 Tax=Ponticoccus alexandrii TaxID=1943633 RepID=A0ABX7FD95_9RHOB|nr:hypothetical protein [Ponticoccus alexandrii]KID12620.1 type I secretion protein [Rhodobacteraceae bacterium PD-2]QRF68125.1 calcium-binding protein [Ponticoccus alexandrii]